LTGIEYIELFFSRQKPAISHFSSALAEYKENLKMSLHKYKKLYYWC